MSINFKWKWNVFQKIMGSLHHYRAQIALFVNDISHFVSLTNNDHTIFTKSSHSYQTFVITWSNDHQDMSQPILGWRWSLFHEIMECLHPYTCNNAPFVVKFLDYAILTRNEHTFFISSLQFHNVFVIIWSNDHRHRCQPFLRWKWSVI